MRFQRDDAPGRAQLPRETLLLGRGAAGRSHICHSMAGAPIGG